MNGLKAARAVLARVLLRIESEALTDHQAHALLSEEIERIDVVLAQAVEPARVQVPRLGPGVLT